MNVISFPSLPLFLTNLISLWEARPPQTPRTICLCEMHPWDGVMSRMSVWHESMLPRLSLYPATMVTSCSASPDVTREVRHSRDASWLETRRVWRGPSQYAACLCCFIQGFVLNTQNSLASFYSSQEYPTQ